MLEAKLLRENFENIQQLLEGRGAPESFSSWPSLDKERRSLIAEAENLRAKKNSLNPKVAAAKKAGEDATALFAELKEIGGVEKEISSKLEVVETQIAALELVIPNLPHSDVPEGLTEDDNVEVKRVGEVKELGFEAKSHADIGEELKIIDFERAAKVSGARFAYLLGDGARLERALAQFMLDKARANGYSEVIPPYLVRRDALVGSGQLPKFEEEVFKTAGEQELFLIPTSEVSLCNIRAGEIVDAAELPIRMCALSPCFRAEAGSYGKDVRGLIRMHQFHKVELVIISNKESSYQEHEKMVSDAEGILEELELPYRRITLCRGDMGFSAAKTYDLEVWLPSQKQYREISSCSNTEGFQARRNKTRYRAGKEKPEPVHMLNGSGLAVGRTLVAVLENYQQADGSVVIPEVLRSYMGGQERIG